MQKAFAHYAVYFIGFFLLISSQCFLFYPHLSQYPFMAIARAYPGYFVLCFFIFPTLFSYLIKQFEKWTLSPVLTLFIIITAIHLWLRTHFIMWVIDFTAVSFILSYTHLLAQNPKQTIAYLIGSILLGFAGWTYLYIGMSDLNQLISTVLFGFSGLLSVNRYFTLSLIRFLLIYPLVLTLTLRLFEPYFYRFRGLIQRSLIITGLALFIIQYNLAQLYTPDKADYFTPHFLNPTHMTFQKPTAPQNLILIYVESLEQTYQSTALFQQDLLSALTHLKQPHLSFHAFRQSTGADWTMGGMVSSQCGLPLKLTTIFKGNDIGANLNTFLPQATCLSDILNTLGYRNVFLYGGALQFAGMDNFLQTHHYHEMLGKKDWLQEATAYSPMSSWGLPDDLLFEKAKVKLEVLVKNKQPFNLTLLTLDTHGVHGYLNQTCASAGGKHFEDIIRCSANQVAQFIQYVDQKGWLANTTMIIMGDHIAMKNDVFSQLKKQSPRYIFNLIVSQKPNQKNRDALIHVDMLPTILSALDITWPSDGQLALGYSGLTPIKKPLNTANHFKLIEKINTSNSIQYNQLWSTTVAN